MNYIDLEVWKKTRELVKLIYKLTNSFPKDELNGLTNQVRRSAISVPSNIAEGCGRQSSKETIHFLYISKGSLYELETQVLLSYDIGYITKVNSDNTIIKITVCKKLLNGFIKYYKSK